jgi:preprotein translocase subunit SecE
MAKDQGVKMPAARTGKRPTRTAVPAKSAAGASAASAAVAEPKKRTSPTQFWQEVRVEARKITWPSWKETWITSVMVFIMVAITAIFFLVVNTGLNFGLQQLLRIAGGQGS